jgi:hypothetical protein
MKNKLTREAINNLPEEVRIKVANTLKAFDEVTIVYEDGEYYFGNLIKAEYSKDHKVIGTIYAKDYYTENERIANYINEFNSYPTNYKGNQDYSILRQLEASKKFDFDNKTMTKLEGVINDNGDFEIVGEVTYTI